MVVMSSTLMARNGTLLHWFGINLLGVEELRTELPGCKGLLEVAATPPYSPTPFERQLDVRHPWQLTREGCF